MTKELDEQIIINIVAGANHFAELTKIILMDTISVLEGDDTRVTEV